MTIEIPDELWDMYYSAADTFIDETHLGCNCTVIYPQNKIECPNCVINTIGGSVANVYKVGGPYQFSGICPLCNGQGYKLEEETDQIRLRVYFNPKYWIKVANMQIVDGRVQVIGYLTDLPKVRRCKQINIVTDLTNLQIWSYALAGDCLPHGFGKNRYFLAFLDKV